MFKASQHSNLLQKGRFLELDALRGFAAMGVMLFHYSGGIGALNYLKYGAAGVDLFFMISGFVILLTIEKTNTVQKFIFNRFSRLYPTYWVCVTITTILLLLFGNLNWQTFGFQYIGNMTMFHYWLKQPNIDPSYWTMPIEMAFYIFIALLLALKQVKWVEQFSFLLFFVACICTIPWVGRHFSYLVFELTFRVPFMNHFAVFFAGIIFYKIKTEGATVLRHSIILLCLLTQAFLFQQFEVSSMYMSLISFMVVLCLYFFTFYLFTYNRLKFIISKTTVYLGKISFPLYLIHQAIGVYIIIPLLTKFVGAWIATVIMIAVSLTLAALIHTFIEAPATGYIRQRYAHIYHKVE